MREDRFAGEIYRLVKAFCRPPLFVRRAAALLYQVEVNNELQITVNLRKPKKGTSAFETDLCIFEKKGNRVEIPRVVLELKSGVSTHDVLTYSAKARKHKQIYPYLRYGMVIAKEATLPKRVFIHNEALDFCLAAASFKKSELRTILYSLIRKEIRASRRLERISFGKRSCRLYRNEVLVVEAGGEEKNPV
ncbi:MAG: hypothetical protein ACE5JJ_11080 [Nitrospinota bacterium]